MMRQGLLSLLLLSLACFAGAVEISPSERQRWLQDERVQEKVESFLAYAKEGEIDSLRFAMERLSLPQQEAARFLLLQKMEQQEMILTPFLAEYVRSLLATPPTYQIRHLGEGYEFTTPAFAYSSIANRLLKRWQHDQTILDFILSVEREELKLEQWLTSGTVGERQEKEKLLVDEMDGLSPPALEFLVEQVVAADNKVVFWLPSTRVMVRLAQVSEDPRVYKMLWRMRADKETEQELLRLMEHGDSEALKQIMEAASNPKLNSQAVKYLTSLSPLPETVQSFLLEKMSSHKKEEASFVAGELYKQGHNSWLRQLLENDKQVNRAAIRTVLPK